METKKFKDYLIRTGLAGLITATAIVANPTQTISQSDISKYLSSEKKVVKVEEPVNTLDSIIGQAMKTVGDYSEIITEDLIKAIIHIESSGNPYARNKKTGARGLMGERLISWEQVGEGRNYFKSVYNPVENIKNGIRYLNWLEEYCEDNHDNWEKLSDEDKIKTIIASWNAGPTNMRDKYMWDIKKTTYETKRFVKKIEEILNF